MFSVMGSGVPGQASGLRLTASGKGDAVQVGRHRACRQFFVARRSYQSEELLREAFRRVGSVHSLSTSSTVFFF